MDRVVITLIQRKPAKPYRCCANFGLRSRRTGDTALAERAVQNLQALPGLRLIEMNQTVIQTAAQLASSCGMRGADSVYAAVAHQLNIPLATLDADQRAKAGKTVTVQKDFS